jgi:threonine synthase
MVWAEAFDTQIGIKLESLNPTGSFKDRLVVPMISFLSSMGVKSAVEDSSGNAGASFAAYAARAGIQARVFIPDYAAGPKRIQIETYGAEVVAIEGARYDTYKALLEVVEVEGAVYASHAYLPHGLPGIATISYEILDQLGESPGTVIAPVGHGSLVLGIFLGFKALKAANQIDVVPTIVGVQAQRCSPVWTAHDQDFDDIPLVKEEETIASGIRVQRPVRGEQLLQLAQAHDIRFVVVEEENIIQGRDLLARLGFYIEPTSAVVWDALAQVIGDIPEPIVLILSGSGLKYIKAKSF